ncbi:MAG: hypothetical protein ACRCVT_15560 [Leadbetterella sp.]
MYTIIVELGDSSGDGHDKTYQFVIDSNLSQTEINEAYTKATNIIGFDLRRDAATECEDDTLIRKHYLMLQKAGLDLSELETEFNPDNSNSDITDESVVVYLDFDQYFNLYMQIVKLGNSDFTFTQIPKSTMYIDIGGYGLFTM